MATRQIEQLINDVVGLTGCDPSIARLWVRDGARRSFEARHWSFLFRRGQFLIPSAITATTTAATCTILATVPTTVTFSGAVATEAVVGRQFRIGTNNQIYDIVGYNSPTSVEIYPQFGGADIVAADNWSIVLAYLATPSDCLMLVSVVDPAYRRQLRLQVDRGELDRYDTNRQRVGGPPVCLSPLDYAPVLAGSIGSVVRINGAGTKPLMGGTFTGQADAIFSVRVSSTDVGGTATFDYQKNDNGWQTGTPLPDIDIALTDGISVRFDSSSVYTSGDIFAAAASPLTSPALGLPRVEMFPYQTAASVYPYLYVSRYPDVTGPDNIALPGLFATRDDIIREKALESAATFPGETDHPNPYAQINRRDYHAAEWQRMMSELELKDNEIRQQNVGRNPYMTLPYAPLPWLASGDLQSQDPSWIYPDQQYYI